MIEFIATALAALIIPAAPLSTVGEVAYNNDSVDSAIYQTNESEASTLSNDSTIIIRTPKGTNVYATTREEGIPYGYTEFYTQYFRNNPQYNLNPIVVGMATTTYNSYAYAFYMYWGGYSCVLTDFSEFIYDGSFVEVDTPQVNDIILYGNSINNNKTFEAIHAGIVTGLTGEASNNVCGNANTVLVQSKWGDLGLYRHKGDECPYVSKYPVYDDYVKFEFYASEVKYFRLHTQHDYTYKLVSIDDRTHGHQCFCGDYVAENHEFTYTSLGDKGHRRTCSCGYSDTMSHTWMTTTSLGLLMEALGLDEEDIELLAVLPKRYVTCTYCGYKKQLGLGEVVPVLPDP